MSHLDDVGMGYSEHMKSAIVLSFLFGLCSMQLMVQAISPFIFINTGRRLLTNTAEI